MDPQDTKPAPEVSEQPDADVTATPQTPPAEPAPDVQAPAYAQPAEELAGQPATSMPSPVVSPGKRRRWLWPTVAVVVLLLLLGGGYVFGMYLPNRPSTIYTASLNRTGEALDALVSYSDGVAQKHYKSYGVNGSVRVKSGSTSYDATLTGNFDSQANASIKLDADVLGEGINANIRSIHVAGTSSPDLYVQVSGIRSMLDSFGLSTLDDLDGQWIAVDHTVLDAAAKTYSQSLATATKAGTVPTAAQMHDALVKVQTVNKQYLFTTDDSKAVLQNQKYVGKEQKDGRSVYHYKVGYNKTHLQAYADALGKALDSSSLNTWSKTANDGKALSGLVDIKSLKEAIGHAKDGYTFDVWVDTGTKLVHGVQFTDPADPTSVFALTQNYTGGTEYPFTLSFTGKDDSGPETGSLKLTVDTATNKDSGTLEAHSAGMDTSFKFNLTPSMDDVQVSAPANAKPVVDLLAGLGLSGNL